MAKKKAKTSKRPAKPSKKKTGEKSRPSVDRPDRYAGPDRRKGPRQMHIIDEDSSPRDIALARSDLENFFLDVLDKHHGF